MKKKRLGLLFLISLAGPALSQTIDGPPRYQLSDAYESFFFRIWDLMQVDLGDSWLLERHFSASDIRRIKYETAQWHFGWQAIQAEPSNDEADAVALGRKFSLEVGGKLESELADGKRFHNMIQDCFHRLRLVPEYDSSCSFPPPKVRRT